MNERESPTDEPLSARIARHVQAPNYRPVKPRVLTKQLGLPETARKDVRRALKQLAREGLVAWGPKHLVRAAGRASLSDGPESRPAADGPLGAEPADATPREAAPRDASPVRTGPAERAPRGKKERRKTRAGDERDETAKHRTGKAIVGTFKRSARGFGFVRPLDALGSGREEDIFIAGPRSLDASSGDRVRVVLTGREGRSENRRRGEIVEVLERRNYRFVGTYREVDGQGEVQVDGKVFAQAIPVGDPGAKGARPDDQVVIEMVRFPRHYDPGQAVITELLGPRGAPGVDTLAILREFDLPGDFPDAAIQVAREQAEAFDESPPSDRIDLSGETIITIDPRDARDFDDAISLVRLDNGHWKLGVHIADVAHFVPLHSALDDEARRRATSVYLPDRVIPMLPELLSNHLASLQPDRLRCTRTVFLEFTPDGIVVSSEIARSVIVSKRRFSYDEVDQVYTDPGAWHGKLAPAILQLLLDMRELAMIVRFRRLDQGAIDLSMPEVKINLDADGRVAGARVIENTVSHQVIEEFMLAANRAVAETLRDAGTLFLRRIHEPPTPIKVRALTDFVRHLGIPCASLESRFEIKRVVAAVKGEPLERAVNYAVLRSMQKAVYGPDETGHYALHWDDYCHFTSPIRRYPDLDVHRMLDDLQDGRRPRGQRGALRTLGEHCSQREQRAEAAERELVKLKLLNYLHDRIGERMAAVITGVEEFGVFAEGIPLPAEGFLAVSSLEDDVYRFDPTARAWIGHREGRRLGLGDVITVEVAHVDLARRELDFRLVETASTAHRRAVRPAKRAASKRTRGTDARRNGPPPRGKPFRRKKR